jgi:hypothetical protein
LIAHGETMTVELKMALRHNPQNSQNGYVGWRMLGEGLSSSALRMDLSRSSASRMLVQLSMRLCVRHARFTRSSCLICPKWRFIHKEHQLAFDWNALSMATSTSTIEQKQLIRLAMEHVQRHGSITNREYREITRAKDTTVLRDLEILLDRGVLRAVGKGRSRKYTLPS